MNERPEKPSSPQPPPRESLEDLVYRSSLAEGNRAVRGSGFRAAGPAALAVYGLLAAGVFLAARHPATGQKVVQSVAIVLQEGPEPPTPAPGPARSAPVPAVHPSAAPALRAPAPPPPVPPQAPPPPPPVPASLAAPDTVPSALPKEDHSRDYGGGTAGKGGAGEAAIPGTGPAGPSGGGGGGGRAGQVPTLDLSRIAVQSRPPKPDYPLLAQKAGIQGSVVVPILVGADGVPISARAVDGPPLLRSAAEKFALAWRFAPYRVNGIAQAFQFTLTVTFTLKR